MTLPKTTAELRALDAAHHLHPFSDTKALNAEGSRVIVKADGVWLTDSDGNRYLDGMSGLWCVNVGYGREEIADAVSKQLRELPYYNTFFKTTHTPAIELAAKLAELTPPQFNRVFFTGSGSESNDTVIRLVRRYWDIKEKPEKKVIISRRNAYHGSTVGAANLGGMAPMHAQNVAIPGVVHIAQPYWWGEARQGETPDEFGLRTAQALEATIDALGEDRIAAFIAEPIQGAGGVIVPPATYWPEIARICRERDILFVSDEVICGFGRTGKWFGCETFGTHPDLLVMAKGITSGYMPLGGVMVADRVVDVLLEGGDFNHGYTYSGHPAACAAALANLAIMQREKLVERVADDIGPYLKARWSTLAEHPLVGEAPMLGMVGALELTPDKAGRRKFPEVGKVGTLARDFSFKNGLVMRAVRDRLIIAPPLVLSHGEADELVARARKTLDDSWTELKRWGWVG
ncbi:aspartate aminotransferase family protein [Ancylobacter defluvii]|uniref:Aspartate aminotransferase family protein n=1 Tax=Ancylobacter defluvii TaxID=1282440 RepID=A0A9W6K0J9_9HYPH|nr:aspartate aminotransferase family protein [Ancylobacter defluvii]MBS7586700.1 aspartate aminotransferase family protein [Ancylobacter defluvii]GLK86001.1 aspartate aminotransferase family protein [Ancylobacter defluvii]